MTKKNDLESLESIFNKLKLKTPIDQLQPETIPLVLEFLKTEMEFRAKHQLHQLFNKCGMTDKQKKTFIQFDWNFNPKVPKNDILAYQSAILKKEPRNLVLLGETGIGKSHLAKALCYEAMLGGLSSYFVSSFDLVSKIKKSIIPANEIEYYGKNVHLLCIDELGYTFHQKEDTDLIFQIISKRSEILPTIITTNLTPKEWGSIFSGPAATTILDRLSFQGKFLNWEGNSYRPSVV